MNIDLTLMAFVTLMAFAASLLPFRTHASTRDKTKVKMVKSGQGRFNFHTTQSRLKPFNIYQ